MAGSPLPGDDHRRVSVRQHLQWRLESIAFAGFIGFEATTIYSEEAKDAPITVPKATYISVLSIGIFYTLTAWLMTMGIGVDKLLPTLTEMGTPPGDAFAATSLPTLISMVEEELGITLLPQLAVDAGIARGHAIALTDGLHVHAQPQVIHRHAFGLASGAGGVDQVGQIQWMRLDAWR